MTGIEIERYDERNNVQARHELVPGSPEWEEYYKIHPKWMEEPPTVWEKYRFGRRGKF